MASDHPSTPQLGFTAPWIKALSTPEERYEVSDRGLCLRIERTGRKVFRWYYFEEVSGSRRMHALTLGPWSFNETLGHLSLAQARAWLDRLKQAHEGGTLAETERELKTWVARGHIGVGIGPTVGELAKDFYEIAILPKRRWPEEVRRTLDKDILPAIGEKSVRAVTTEDCRNIILAVVKRGSPSQAGKVFDHLSQFFTWAQGYGAELSLNPTSVLKKDALGVMNNERERFLSADEIPLYWHALKKTRMKGRGLSDQVQLALRLLLLVPERTGELIKSEWAEVDLDEAIWTVPVAHQKLNPKQVKRAKPWRVPLTEQVLDLFRKLKALAGKSRFVLASDTEAGRLSDKALIQALTSLQEKERQKKGKKITATPLLDLPGGHLTVHDLRHTFRTLAVDKLGVLPFVAERCLHHSQGQMEGRYDHYDYLKERRAALELWSGYVYRLIASDTSNIAFLSARASHIG